MQVGTRIVPAFLISFLLGLVFSLSNGQDLLPALRSASIFALLVAILVAILSWGIDIAVKKGYPGWVGFLLVLILNIPGLVILILLPGKIVVRNNPASK
jgi:hypothetical protein